MLKSFFAGLVVASGLASAAVAAPLTFEFTEFTGQDSRLRVTVEQQDANTLKFSLSQPVQGSELQGELRAFYFNVANEALLPSLVITNISPAGFITASQKIANGVSDLGGDTNLNGGNAQPFDIGIGFGSNGSDGFIYNAVFTLSYSGGLDLDTFFPLGADQQLFGARLKPFTNDTSSKLLCDAPCGYTPDNGPDPQQDVPVPASLALLGAGLFGLGTLGRRRRG